MSKYPEQPPPYGFQNGPPQMNTNAPPPPVTQQVTVIHQVVGPVGPDPQTMTCPKCQRQITTRVISEATTKTHLMALLLCCFLCWPCACVPYCMDTCKNINHYCPSCNSFIGTYAS